MKTMGELPPYIRYPGKADSLCEAAAFPGPFTQWGKVPSDKMRPVFVSGVVGNREIPKPTVGSAARVSNEVQRAQVMK